MKHFCLRPYFLLLVLVSMSVSLPLRAKEEKTLRNYELSPLTVLVADTVPASTSWDFAVTEAEELLTEPDVYLYPNPTNGPISLEVKDEVWQGGTATLYNLIGESLDQRVIVLGSNAYDMTSFSSGFYFLNLSKGELQKTLRFMKR